MTFSKQPHELLCLHSRRVKAEGAVLFCEAVFMDTITGTAVYTRCFKAGLCFWTVFLPELSITYAFAQHFPVLVALHICLMADVVKLESWGLA